MKKNKILIGLVVVFVSFSLIGCGKKNNTPSSVLEFGEIESTENISSESETNISNTEKNEEKDVSLPYYDVTNLVTPKSYTDSDLLTTKSSYYKEQLDARLKRAFDSIYSASLNKSTSIELDTTQIVTPSELEKIMNIIFLDCPELFYLDNQYSYQTNGDGYVYKIVLQFSMTPENITALENKIAETKPNILSNKKSNDYETIRSFMNQIKDEISYGQIVVNEDGSLNVEPSQIIIDFYKQRKINSLGVSKTISYWLRELGIDSTVVVGDLVSTNLANSYELTSKSTNFSTQSITADGFYHVQYNYSYYWIWNLVKIDDNWYNIDKTYSYLLNEQNKLIPRDCLVFVPDLVMSQTRLSYLNESILGMSPSCTDNNYQDSYRNGEYVLSHTETQAVLRLKQDIAKIDKENLENITYQFQDEATYNYFCNNLDEQMIYYNDTYGEPIGKYSVMESRDSLTLVVYGIINNY